MNEDEVKELIDAEVERRVKGELAKVTPEIVDKAGDRGFKAGMLGFLICVALTGIVLITVEIFTHGVIGRDNSVSSASRDDSVFLSSKDDVLVQEATDDFALEETDELVAESEIGEHYRIIIEEDWKIRVTEYDNHYNVSLSKSCNDSSVEDRIFLQRYNNESFASVLYTNMICYGGGRSAVHDEIVMSYEADSEKSAVNFVSVGNQEFPVSDEQVKLLKKYLKLVPI